MISRSPIKRRRPGKPRKGRVTDKSYLAWIHTQPCLVSGRLGVTAHHVRFCGSPKNDRRTVPLMAEYHLIGYGPTSVEALGKGKFQKLHGVDLEAAIVRYNQLYEAQRSVAA